MRERKEMSAMERNLLTANQELVNKQKLMLKDIIILIGYIKGNASIEDEVNNIVKYYTTKNPPGKYE